MGNAIETQQILQQSMGPQYPIPKLTFFIDLIDQTLKIQISSNRTCLCLLQKVVSEAINNKSKNANNIVALESIEKLECIDYWLMNGDFNLDRFGCDNIKLKAIYSENIQNENEININDFLFLKCIGKGGTSTVYLIRHKKTGNLFALKQIPKSFLQDQRKFKQIMVEREVLSKLNEKFLAKLITAFESEFYLNFLMEYYPGGELFFHLKKKRFSEETAKFYIAQIIFALESLHDLKIVYRDLKPENLILDIFGYLKLTDFGLCKMGLEESELTYSFCGSPEYMAPEIIGNIGHTYTVDFYTLGALLFEFMTGLPPFYAKTPFDIMQNMKNKNLNFPDSLSNDLKELLTRLLSKDPNSRINSFKELKELNWLKTVDWNGIYDKKYKAPIELNLTMSYLHDEFKKFEFNVDNIIDKNLNFKREYNGFELFCFEKDKYFTKINNTIIKKSEKRLSSVPCINNLNKTEKKPFSNKKEEDLINQIKDNNFVKLSFTTAKSTKYIKKYFDKNSKNKTILEPSHMNETCKINTNAALTRNLSFSNCSKIIKEKNLIKKEIKAESVDNEICSPRTHKIIGNTKPLLRNKTDGKLSNKEDQIKKAKVFVKKYCSKENTPGCDKTKKTNEIKKTQCNSPNVSQLKLNDNQKHLFFIKKREKNKENIVENQNFTKINNSHFSIQLKNKIEKKEETKIKGKILSVKAIVKK